MHEYKYSIKLTSDAEPGTGLGSELVNDFVPRDYEGRSILPASHTKGLMRAALVEITEHRGWSKRLVELLFGRPDQRLPEETSAFSLTPATSVDGTKAFQLVTRTRIGEAGVVVDKSLRTTESLATETKFSGSLYCAAAIDSVEDLAWRLALLSVNAVGSNRNRGSGACYVEINSESRSPGMLLKKLDQLLSSWEPHATAKSKAHQATRTLTGRTVVMRLVFQASSPICCPEIADRSNVILTGFSVPASSVQGALLTSINQSNSSLATALFEHACFRTWPLQPVDVAGSSDELPLASLRVSLTHKVAKYSVDGHYKTDDFHDEALERSLPSDRTKGAPLKSTDGVLRCEASGQIQLWRASDMPHVITSHGVHAEKLSDRNRNLFTVDAMAPLVWQGLLTLPEDAVDEVQAILNKFSQISIGKSRTVRGQGKLTLVPISGIPREWQSSGENTVWIVQSPIAFTASPSESVEKVFMRMANGWSDAMQIHSYPKVWANNGVLFGYNRMREGLQQAQRVILPGAVIDFGKKIEEQVMHELFTSGRFLPDQRQHGYGAISVHPGKANSLFHPSFKLTEVVAGSDNFATALKQVLAIARLSTLPSVSQIREVQRRIDGAETKPAMVYLRKQCDGRTQRIWSDWEHCKDQLLSLLEKHPKTATRALEVLADLAMTKKPEEQE